MRWRADSAYKFRSNSNLYLTGDLRQMLPGVTAYGIQFDLNLYVRGTQPIRSNFINTPWVEVSAGCRRNDGVLVRKVYIVFFGGTDGLKAGVCPYVGHAL